MTSASSAIATPNDLEAYWMPFTANRSFKKNPRMVARAEGMFYYTPDNKPVMDGTAGLWCCNAGHAREPIIQAIQAQARDLDYAPSFQYGHPKVFAAAARIAALAPGDLDHVFFAGSGSEAADSALKIALALSVLAHFATAMWWRRRGMLNGRRSQRLHLSVFCHVLVIVLLAKAMFYWHW